MKIYLACVHDASLIDIVKAKDFNEAEALTIDKDIGSFLVEIDTLSINKINELKRGKSARFKIRDISISASLYDAILNLISIYRNEFGWEDDEPLDGDQTDILSRFVLIIADEHQGNDTPDETRLKLELLNDYSQGKITFEKYCKEMSQIGTEDIK